MRGWKRLALSGETPCARSGAASAVIGEMMYMFGGFGGSMRLNDLHSFSFDLFGGFNGTEWLNDFYEFDIDSHLWTRLPKVTSSSSSAASTTSQEEPESESLHPTSSNAPSPRFGFVSCVYSKKIIIFGGFDGQQWLDDLHVFDITTQAWTQVTQYGRIPSPRSCPSWSVQGNIALVFGGFNGNNRMNDLHLLMLDSYCWSEIESFGSVPSARYFHGSAVHDNTLYVFGGYDGSERLSDMSSLNLINRVWKPVSVTCPDTGSSLSGINLMISNNTTGSNSAVVVNCSLAEIMSCPNPALLSNNGDSEESLSTPSSGYMLTNTHFTISNSRRNNTSSSSLSSSSFNPLLASSNHQTSDLAGEGSLSQLDASAASSLFNSSYYNSQSLQSPGGRSSFVAQSSENVMIIFGGYNGSEVLDELWEFRYFAISIPTPTLSFDMRRLVNHDEFYDVVFEVEGKEIHAHRAILAIRSDHFRALLYGGMKETSSNRISIEHASYGAFHRLIHFLYTDELVHDGNLDILFELLSLADTYILFRLKRMCEDRIVRGIAIDNVCPMLLAGHRLRADALKDQCLAFLLENLDRVKQTESFGVLKEEPDLLLHIIMRQSSSSSSSPTFNQSSSSPSSSSRTRNEQLSASNRSTSWLTSRLSRQAASSTSSGTSRQSFLADQTSSPNRNAQYDRSVGAPVRNPPPVPLEGRHNNNHNRHHASASVSSPNQATMSLASTSSSAPHWTARRVLPTQTNNRQDDVDFHLNYNTTSRWGLALLGTEDESNLQTRERHARREEDDDDDDDSDGVDFRLQRPNDNGEGPRGGGNDGQDGSFNVRRNQP